MNLYCRAVVVNRFCAGEGQGRAALHERGAKRGVFHETYRFFVGTHPARGRHMGEAYTGHRVRKPHRPLDVPLLVYAVEHSGAEGVTRSDRGLDEPGLKIVGWKEDG